MEIGEWWSKPARTLRKNAQSVTLRATGPETESVNQPSRVGTSGTRPGEVRMPTTLQKFGGLRSEPPMSLPSASGTMPQASATAPPPVLPPQVFVTSYGFRVAPKTLLNVCEPSPNSGTFVLPIAMQRRPKGGANPSRLVQILHAHRHPVQRPQHFPLRQRLIRGSRLRHQLF